MNKYLKLSILVLLLVGLGHLISRRRAYYGDYWYADIILHVSAGIALALFWIGLAGRPMKRSEYLSVVLFAVFGSFLWELWEFSGLHLVPDKLIYKPTLPDSLGDITSGMVGGIIVSLTSWIRSKRV
jgi:hypothetical protein